MKISDAIQGYEISSLADGFSPLTIAGYRSHLRKLQDYLLDTDVVRITHHDLARFLAWLQTDYQPRRSDSGELSQAALHSVHKAIRSFFKWAAAELEIVRPDLAFKTPRYQNKEIIPYTQDEIERMKKAAVTSRTIEKAKGFKPYRFECQNSDRNQAILLALLDTGMRPGECCRLRVMDVDLAGASIQIIPHRKGKTRARTLPISPRTCKAIWKYLQGQNRKPHDYAFLTLEGNQMTRYTLGSFFADLGRRAGVSHANPYRMRHTFAIQSLRNGMDVYALQYLLGHADFEMCRTYLRLAQTDVVTAHRQASPVDRWRL
jgi:integrase/recombinase XerD